MTQADERALMARDGTDLAPSFVVSADVIASRMAELQDFVKGYMVEGEDFGVIPGTNKPTLYKPGAEKLCDVYGFQRLFVVTSRIEEWDRGLFSYEVRCDLVSMRTGLTVAQGLGNANTWEERYRWRQRSRSCPACGLETLIKGRAEYGGGWVCFRKRGGCGATYGDEDPAIMEQATGRVENDEPYTLVNTVLKIAKKRALVDAVLSATRSSGMFTQDLEDYAPAVKASTAMPEPARPAPGGERRPDGWKPAPVGDAPNCSDCNEIMEWHYREKDGKRAQWWGCPNFQRGSPKHVPLYIPLSKLAVSHGGQPRSGRE